MIETRFLGAATILLLAPAGDGDQHHASTAILLPDPASRLVAVQLRQAEVQEDHLRLERRRRSYGFQAVVSRVDLVAHHAQ